MKPATSPNPREPRPAELSRWRRPLLAVAIVMEAVWIALLAAMAIAR